MKKTILLLRLVFYSLIVYAGGDPGKGKAIFTARCTACHAIDHQIVGPALKNIDKLQSEQWIINYVHSSQKVIKSGDTAAVKIFNKFNKVIMPDHPDLTDNSIRDIIAFIHDESQLAPTVSASAAINSEEIPLYGENDNGVFHKIAFLNLEGSYKPITSKDTVTWLVIIIFITLFIAILFIGVKVQKFELLNRGRVKSEKSDTYQM